MTISRWKVMAGILGVSLGGLAAVAGQNQISDAKKTHRAAEPPAPVEGPKVAPGGSGPVAPPAKPPTPATPPLDLSVPLPAGDLLAPPGAVVPKLPAPAGAPASPAKPLDLPAAAAPVGVPPSSAKMTDLFVVPAPVGPAKPALPKAEVLPAGALVVPPPSAGVVPTFPAPLDTIKSPAPALTEPPAPAKPADVVPESVKPTHAPAIAVEAIPAKPAAPAEFTRPAGGRPVPPATLIEPVPADAIVETVVKPAAAVAPALSKFRIVLRVGEGEPTFEVRHGDDLVMKVLCEKVDIKSPEKGQGMSAVIATGKVRFVGFGAEGTCDSFSFLAGTGEVAMTGNVKVQVKDKIGRVESELTTEKMQYRLDSNAMPGVLKP